jgi:superfamily II DNA or RNA helicase
MIKLRPYQEELVNSINASLSKNKRIIACSATGSGKTKVFVHITHLALAKNKAVLIITERTKIYKQIKNEFPNTKIELIAEGVKHVNVSTGNVYIAMAQTLTKRPFILAALNALCNNLLIINDEAHISWATKPIKQLPNAYLIGFTATPDAKFAKHLPELYNDCVVGPQPQFLIEQGFLCPYNHFERRLINKADLVKSSTGDYTEASQEKAFEKREVFDGLLTDIYAFKYKKCMIFTASIQHCRTVANQLRGVGFAVSEVHSKNPNSDYELFQFTDGPIDLCVSVGSLTAGFDCPVVDLIMLLRATLSTPLYCQILGRGSRPAPGKSSFTVVDYGLNGTRHGLWNQEREWDKLWKQTKANKNEKAAPVKLCDNCGFLMAPASTKCPNCGTEQQPKKQTEQEKKETLLVELTGEFNKLRGRRISSLTPDELAVYVRHTNKKAFGKRIAKAQGQEFLEGYAKAIKWKYGWWNHIVAEPLEFADVVVR